MERERPWRIAIRGAAWIVGVLLVVLVVTGVLLTAHPQSPGSGAYANAADLEHHALFSARSVHRAAAGLFIAAVGGVVLASVGLGLTRWNRRSIALPALVVVSTLAAVFTGDPLIHRVQLWGVTVGTSVQPGSVSTILLGSSTSGPAAYGGWFWTHAALLPLVVAVALVALLLTARPRTVH